MIFIDNKYTKWYYSIIHKAQSRSTISDYVERHHIIPKSIGGTNDKLNLVKLTLREHFVCHRLLIKMTNGYSRIKMLHALGMFAQKSPLQKRKFSSREYEIIRKSISNARTGSKHPGIGGVKKGTIPWNKNKKQGPHTDQSNKSRSTTMKNKPSTICPHCGKIGKGNVMKRYHFNNCKTQ
jgi:hypothetical protein